MIKLMLFSAAMIVVAALSTEGLAASARSEVVVRHATLKGHSNAADCIRAPDVGAFASAPYTVPPCMPGNR